MWATKAKLRPCPRHLASKQARSPELIFGLLTPKVDRACWDRGGQGLA